MKLRVIAAVFFALVVWSGGAYWRVAHAAQEPSLPVIDANRDAGNPVLLTSQECAPDTSASRGTNAHGAVPLKCVGRLVNNGSKALSAIALEWVAYDDAGKVICRVTTVDDYAFPMPGSRGSIAAGEEFSSDGKIRPNAAKVVARIIFEEFADRSTWGNTNDETYVKLTAERMGAETILGGMRDAKKNQSADEVLKKFGIE